MKRDDLQLAPQGESFVASQASFEAALQAIAGFAQVDLFEPVSEAHQGMLRWWSPLAIAASVAALALASSLWLTLDATALAQKVAREEAQVQDETQRIEAATRQNRGAGAADQAGALQAALAREERLLAALGGGGARPAAGPTAQDFSALLEGLADTRVDGLWLTQVRFDRRNREVRLEGQTRDAKLVSAYIDDLGRNDRFKGLVLAGIDVSRPVVHSAGAADAVEPTRFKLTSAVVNPAPAP